eukprot:4334958-Pyramimonas_sp.AAC.1
MCRCQLRVSEYSTNGPPRAGPAPLTQWGQQAYLRRTYTPQRQVYHTRSVGSPTVSRKDSLAGSSVRISNERPNPIRTLPWQRS